MPSCARMGLYDAILGIPFVYDHVRPLVVGGIDLSPLYQRLLAHESAVVLDIGCGTGDAHRYLEAFGSYVGFDVDKNAVRSANKRFGTRPHVRFESRLCTEDDVRSIAPSHVVLAGLLHHLTDAQALDTLRMLRASPRLERIVTLDPVYVPGARINNLLARLDRGEHVRDSHGYIALARQAGVVLRDSITIDSRPQGDRAKYFVMTLEPLAT